MVESKSLKLYLFSFRNHGDFHEDCINIIMKDLIKLMEPRYIEVIGYFTPRGGIAIRPFAQWADDAHQALLPIRMAAHMSTQSQNPKR
jgi:7-cyano-7-deazaguanine reductase